MCRFFVCLILSLLLLPAPKETDSVQPVFFSMLFPQLMPHMQLESETIGEAVLL